MTQSTSYSDICILRLSAIGDVCHAVSAVQAIQKAHPKAKITWVIGKVEAMLLADLPGVEFVVFDKKEDRFCEFAKSPKVLDGRSSIFENYPYEDAHHNVGKHNR